MTGIVLQQQIMSFQVADMSDFTPQPLEGKDDDSDDDDDDDSTTPNSGIDYEKI